MRNFTATGKGWQTRVNAAARAWREYLGLTQDEVATKMGITQSALAQIEASSKPRKATRQKLALALGINVEQLI